MTTAERALEFVKNTHGRRSRRLTNKPHYEHCHNVYKTLCSVTDDESILIAGILHDTIEDTLPLGTVTYATIQEEFGETIAEYVNALSEDKTKSWTYRKSHTLQAIASFPHEVLLIKSADMIDNMSDTVNAFQRSNGDMSIFDAFNGTREEAIAYRLKRVKEIAKAWPENPLLPQLQKLADQLPLIPTESLPGWLQ